MTPKHMYLYFFLVFVLEGGTTQITSKQTNIGMNQLTTEHMNTGVNQLTTKLTGIGVNQLTTTHTESRMSATSDATLKPTSLPAHCHIIEDTSACYSVSRLHDNTPRSSTVSIIDNGSVSKHVYYDFMQYSLYVQFGLVLLGILTNVCSITVFTRKQMKSATSTILTFLSCSELGVAIVELIMVSFSVAMGHMAYTSHIFWTLFRWCRVYLTIVFQRCSFCFNILVATERFIVVRFPLKAKQILRRRNPVIFCAVISATIFGINTFNPLKMEVVPVHTKRGMIYTIQNSQLYTNDPDTFEVLSVFTKIIFSYIPLFGCLLMNILMVTALLNNRKERKRMQTNRNAEHLNDRREIHTTVTILVSTFLFVLLSLPVTTTSIVESTNPEYGEQKREHYLFRFLVQFNGLLYLLSLSMDFLVYMILSRAFQQTFIHLLRSTSCHHASGIVEGHTSATMSIKLSRSVSSRVETSMSVPRHKVAEDVDRENTVTEELGSSVNVTDGFGVTVETEALRTDGVILSVRY